MKKLVVCGVLSLFMGGIAHASTSNVESKSTLIHASTPTDEIRIVSVGEDAGGFYYIVDTGMECRKVYFKIPSVIPGMIEE